MSLALMIAAAVLAIIIIFYLATAGGVDASDVLGEVTALRTLGLLAALAVAGAVILQVVEILHP